MGILMDQHPTHPSPHAECRSDRGQARSGPKAFVGEESLGVQCSWVQILFFFLIIWGSWASCLFLLSLSLLVNIRRIQFFE